jgi:hypothetical protein
VAVHQLVEGVRIGTPTAFLLPEYWSQCSITETFTQLGNQWHLDGSSPDDE